jgi:hypothetical protein
MVYVYIVERGLGDSPSDPQTEIVGVFSTVEAAEAAMLKDAPGSGSVDRWPVDAGDPETVVWRDWDGQAKATVTRRP